MLNTRTNNPNREQVEHSPSQHLQDSTVHDLGRKQFTVYLGQGDHRIEVEGWSAQFPKNSLGRDAEGRWRHSAYIDGFLLNSGKSVWIGSPNSTYFLRDNRIIGVRICPGWGIQFSSSLAEEFSGRLMTDDAIKNYITKQVDYRTAIGHFVGRTSQRNAITAKVDLRWRCKVLFPLPTGPNDFPSTDLRIASVSVDGGILRLNLSSDVGKSTGTVFFRIDDFTLIKATENGTTVYQN
jgi:hypothetical protein